MMLRDMQGTLTKKMGGVRFRHGEARADILLGLSTTSKSMERGCLRMEES